MDMGATHQTFLIPENSHSSFEILEFPRMKKKELNPVTYKCLMVLFQILCFCGLLYQDVQISVNYFKYDVVSEISLIRSEDTTGIKSVNFCFDLAVLHNKSKMSEKLKGDKPKSPEVMVQTIKNWTIRDRFSISIDPKDLIFYPGSKSICRDVEKFILAHQFICYHFIRSDEAFGCFLRMQFMENVTSVVLVAMSDERLYVDESRYNILSLKLDLQNKTTYVMVSDHSYTLNKLKHPYVEDCFDYNRIGFRNELDATFDCYHKHSDGKVVEGETIRETDGKLLDSATEQIFNRTLFENCKNKFPKKMCNQKIIFTRSSIQAMDLKPQVAVVVTPSQDPSFVITSTPRIDFIDYFTFILGTVGAWLGISVLSLNPIPSLFATKSEIISQNGVQQHNFESDRQKVRKCEKELNQFKLWCRKVDSDLKQMKQRQKMK